MEDMVGKIVKVILDCKFQGFHGEVVKIRKDAKEDPVSVLIPDVYPGLYRDDFDPFGSRLMNFEVEDLEMIKQGIVIVPELEQYFDLMFGRSMWHTVSDLATPLLIGHTVCMYEGCKKFALLKIFVNYHGNVCAYYVCPDHAKYHGMNTECFECKKQHYPRTGDFSKLINAIRYT